MRRPPAVAFVALAAQLRDIARQHRLNRRGPSPQAQPIEAPLEVLKSLDNQWRQRQRPRHQRRPLVHFLKCPCNHAAIEVSAEAYRKEGRDIKAGGDCHVTYNANKTQAHIELEASEGVFRFTYIADA